MVNTLLPSRSGISFRLVLLFYSLLTLLIASVTTRSSYAQSGGTCDTRPGISQSIPSNPIRPDAPNREYNLLLYFSDTNEGSCFGGIEYLASSSNSNVIRASVSVNTLIIDPIALGTATITVTARYTAYPSLSTTQQVTIQVRYPNQPPAVEKSITGFGEENKNGINEISNLGQYFVDSDHSDDELTYSLQYIDRGSGYISAEIANRDNITLTYGELADEATVEVTCTDPEGGSASQSFTIKTVNIAPNVSISEESFNINRFFSSELISLRSRFSDADSDPLTYELVSGGNQINNYRVEGENLVVERKNSVPYAHGSDEITVRARDNEGAVSGETAKVNLNFINTSPQIKTSLPSGLQVNKNFTTRSYTGSEYYQDPDKDALNYSVESSNNSVVVAAETTNGFRIESPSSPQAGEATVSIVVTDGKGGRLEDEISVKVINRGITINDVPNPAPVNAGYGSKAVNIGNVFADPDGDLLNINFSANPSGAVRLSRNGDILTITELSGNEENVTITLQASDGIDVANTSFDFLVRNQPPTFIPNSISDKESGFNEFDINLDSFFSDPNGDQLRYTLISGPDPSVSLNVSGNRLFINSISTNRGPVNFTIEASDQDANNELKEEGNFSFTILNDPPALTSAVPDQSLSTGFGTRSISLENRYNDPNQNDEIEIISVSSSNPGFISAGINEVSGVLILTEEALRQDEAQITVTISDGDLQVTDEFIVTTENIPPQLVPQNTPGISELPVNFGSRQINIDGLFTDPNGNDENITYEVVTEGNNFSAEISYPWLTINEVNKEEYTARITILATDEQGATSSYSYLVDIVNTRPEAVGTLEGGIVPIGFERTTILVKRLFFDQNGDELTLTASTDQPTHVSATIEKDSLVITELVRKPGVVNITVTANDGRKSNATNSVSTSFTFENVAPVVANSPGNVEYPSGFSPKTINLDNIFEDENGDQLTYSVHVFGFAIDAKINNNLLEIEERFSNLFSVNVEVTATDGEFSVNETLTISTTNQAPVVTKKIPDQEVERNFFRLRIELKEFFEDPNGDFLNYSVEASKFDLIGVDATNSAVIINQLANQQLGDVNIRVTAFDNNRASVTSSFTITIVEENQPPQLAVNIDGSSINYDVPTEKLFTSEPLDSLFVDPEGDDLQYRIIDPTPSWLSFDESTGRITGIPPAGTDSLFTVIAEAEDERGRIRSLNIVMNVDSPIRFNKNPVIVLSPADTVIIMPDEDSLARVPLNALQTYDPDGLKEQLDFRWVMQGNTLSSLPLDTILLPPGNYNILAVVSDTFNTAVSKFYSVQIEIEENTEDAPELVHPLPDVTAQVKRPFEFVLPDSTFIDVDGENPLKFFVPVNRDTFPNWLKEDFFPSKLSGIPDEVDTLLVEARARDSIGLTATDTFQIVVEPFRNQVPEWYVAELPNLTYRAKDTINFRFSDTLFYDPDGDQTTMQLREYGSSTLPNWLSYNSQQSALTGIPAESDTGNFQLIATVLDEFGAKSQKEMVITILPAFNGPIVIPRFNNTLRSGEPLELQASVIPGDTAVANVSLTLEKASSAFTFQQAVPMKLRDSLYTSSITPFFFRENKDKHGYIYHVTATDYNNESVTASDTITYYINEDDTLDSGIEPIRDTYTPTLADYQIISLPFEDLAVDSVLKNLGEQNIKTWRLFTYEEGAFREYPAFSNFETGQGYMLIHNVKDAAIHYSGQLLEEQEITLYPGMNLVGNPYNLNLSWEAIIDYNSEKLDEESLSKFIRLWNGTYQAGENQLYPLEGGFIEWKHDEPVTIRLPFKMPQQPSQQRERKQPLKGWTLPIALKSKSMGNATGGIGMTENAQEGRDRFDLGTLPRFMNYLELTSSDHLSRSIVPFRDEYTWLFELNSNKQEPVNLSWDQEITASLPGNLYLWNETRQEIINMLQQNEYITRPGARIKIMYSSDDTQVLDRKIAVNRVFRVYPNPVQTRLTTRVSTSGAGKPVTLSIFNQQGQRVQHQQKIAPDKGLQKLEWKTSGLPTGLYYYQVTVGKTYSKQGKLVVK